MAFNKFAKAGVVKSAITFAGWDEIRHKAKETDFSKRKSSKVVLEQYDPEQFLLSHCTIIASVDSENVANQPLGKLVVENFQIDRKYADYHVTTDTLKYINNNNDCWERKLLMSSFRTFTGGENYVEHIQIPELSKGKIIDSAARDIGESVYVDILVATDRKHRPLVEAISNGQLKTLSMGCQVQFTLCTKCGNVAYDETQLCPHVKYFKGSDFYDSFGKKRKIAELCGHVSAEPGSVRFIEASWVANPAFTGAVLRNILSPEDVANLNGKLSVAFSQPARTQNGTSMAKAARSLNLSIPEHVRRILADDFGTDPQEAETPKDDKKPEADPLSKAVGDLATTIRDHVTTKLREEITKDDMPKADIDENRENESIIKSALQSPEWRAIARSVVGSTGNNLSHAKKIFWGLILHKSGGWAEVVKTGSFNGRELLAISRQIDLLTKRASKAGESRLYRTVLAVNGMVPYTDTQSYLAACRGVLGRDLNTEEKIALTDLGRLFDLGS